MPKQSLQQACGLRQPCCVCGENEATLRVKIYRANEPVPQYCEICADNLDVISRCIPFSPPPSPQRFFRVDHGFTEFVQQHLSRVELRVYLAVGQLCDNRRTPIGQSQLVEHCGVGRSYIRAALDKLEAVGLIARISRHRKATRFLIVRPGVANEGHAMAGSLIRPDVYERAGLKLSLGSQGIRTRGIVGDPSFGSPTIPRSDRRGSEPGSDTYYGPHQQNASIQDGTDAILIQAWEECREYWEPDWQRAAVLRRLRNLYRWSVELGKPSDAETLVRFMRQTARDPRLLEQHEAGRISLLAVGTSKDRWVTWLRHQEQHRQKQLAQWEAKRKAVLEAKQREQRAEKEKREASAAMERGLRELGLKSLVRPTKAPRQRSGVRDPAMQLAELEQLEKISSK